ncbi:MAG: FAD-dependent oxidoreductase [Thermaerobacter sp.]|nr:FAD-dependent oxidoreductase [Thermaerobacter sp.]
MTPRILVIGAGIAGLSTVWALAARGFGVTLVSKTDDDASNSYLAQGGIAGAGHPDDAPHWHAADTLAVARGLAHPEAVRQLTENAATHLKPLLAAGILAKTRSGAPHLDREAGHRLARIWHAPDGFTGRAVTRWLIQRLTDAPGLVRIAGRAVRLIGDPARCRGAWLDTGEGRPRPVLASHTVLATGGFAGLFPKTSNPLGTVGDGLWLAHRIGAVLADLEFIQFHPTVLASPGRRPALLLTEALRGAGGHLLDRRGRRILADHPQAELAPRDEVARAVFRHRPVYLAMSHCPPDALHFPALAGALQERGWHLARDPLPVEPGAHYTMGGIVTDLTGRTTVPGLWAVGEAAHSGVHGANRLASNSLLEGMVFGTRCGHAIADCGRWPQSAEAGPPPIDPAGFWDEAGPEISRLSEGLGVERTESGIDAVIREMAPYRGSHVALDLLHWTAASALARRESRGAHWRADFPTARLEQRGHWLHRRGQPLTFSPGTGIMVP